MNNLATDAWTREDDTTCVRTRVNACSVAMCSRADDPWDELDEAEDGGTSDPEIDDAHKDNDGDVASLLAAICSSTTIHDQD